MTLRKPKAGDPISAKEYGMLVDVAAAAAGLSVDGADAYATTGGRQIAVRSPGMLRLVELTTGWTWNPTSNDTSSQPGGWHYAKAKPVRRFPQGGWSTAKPEKDILVWAPAGYPGTARAAMRSDANPTIPPRYRVGDWCWAAYQPDGGLWLLVDGYERIIEATLTERLDACGTASAVAESGFSFTVHDSYGRVADWRFASLDSAGYYAPQGTAVLCRYIPRTDRWVLYFLRGCEGGSSSSEPPSSSASSDSGDSSASSISSKSSESGSSESTPSSASGSSSGAPSESSGPSESSAPSESQAPSESWSGSDKSTAIVPASWSHTGYAALFIHEMPEVRFDDVMVVTVPREDQEIRIDPHFEEVCERGTIEVCGIVPDKPILVGARARGDSIRLTFADQDPKHAVRLAIRLTGIRRGFAGKRFPARTRQQFLANEAFINSAYPSDPKAEH